MSSVNRGGRNKPTETRRFTFPFAVVMADAPMGNLQVACGQGKNNNKYIKEEESKWRRV